MVSWVRSPAQALESKAFLASELSLSQTGKEVGREGQLGPLGPLY